MARSSVVLVACLLAASGARADEEGDMDAYRERVQHGVEKYSTGAYREAIGWWDPVYRELGPQKAYRIAFNLARAYEKFSDFTQAAEHYEAFLAVVVARREAGEEIADTVEKQAKEASERMQQLRDTKARIRVNAGVRPTDVQIDKLERRAAGFVAYVVPGSHTVRFLSGNETLEQKDVTLDAGEVIDVTPPAPPEPKPVQPTLRKVHEVNRPFSPYVLYVAAGVTALSTIVPIVVYTNAIGLANTYNDPATTTDDKLLIGRDYSSARTAAYASLAVPLSLAALTGGLTAFYFWGTKERDVIVATPTLLPLPGGMTIGATGRF